MLHENVEATYNQAIVVHTFSQPTHFHTVLSAIKLTQHIYCTKTIVATTAAHHSRQILIKKSSPPNSSRFSLLYMQL